MECGDREGRLSSARNACVFAPPPSDFRLAMKSSSAISKGSWAFNCDRSAASDWGENGSCGAMHRTEREDVHPTSRHVTSIGRNELYRVYFIWLAFPQ